MFSGAGISGHHHNDDGNMGALQDAKVPVTDVCVCVCCEMVPICLLFGGGGEWRGESSKKMMISIGDHIP